MRDHDTPEIHPTRDALHGQFSRDLPPVVTVRSGERVRFVDTLDISWGMGQHPMEGSWRAKFEGREPPRDDGPGMSGPVAVEGAQPGDVLAITFERIVPHGWGWTYAANMGVNKRLMEAVGLADAPPHLVRWTIDPNTRTARSQHGHQVAIRPFLGTIGMPQDVEGWQTGWHPRRTGGNMDCRELVEGTTLYLPVEVPGGLLSLGDGHAAQGDGEVAGSAIECRMQEVLLHLEIAPAPLITEPHARTPHGWLTLAFDADLEAATHRALSHMLDLMTALRGWSRADALVLASATAHVRTTQLVNGVQGAHVLWDEGAVV